MESLRICGPQGPPSTPSWRGGGHLKPGTQDLGVGCATEPSHWSAGRTRELFQQSEVTCFPSGSWAGKTIPALAFVERNFLGLQPREVKNPNMGGCWEHSARVCVLWLSAWIIQPLNCYVFFLFSLFLLLPCQRKQAKTRLC